MQSTVRIETDEKAMAVLDEQIGRLEVLDREPALKAAMRKAASVPARRLRQILPKPGYPGDKPGKKPLNRTVKVKVKKYDRVTVAMMGYDWNGGQHGHNVEVGHVKVLWGRKTGERVAGKGYLRKAVEDTKTETSRTLETGIEEVVNKALRK